LGRALAGASATLVSRTASAIFDFIMFYLPGLWMGQMGGARLASFGRFAGI
jgi:hypothetical protein